MATLTSSVGEQAKIELPPFQDLLTPDDLAPPFTPLAYDEPAPAPRASFSHRWKTMPIALKTVAIALTVGAFSMGVLMVPSRADTILVSQTIPTAPPEVVREKVVEPTVVPVVEKFEELVVTIAEIPQNTLVTKENLAQFFKTFRGEVANSSAVHRVEDLLNKYAQKILPKNQIVLAESFAANKVQTEPPVMKHSIKIYGSESIRTYEYESQGGDQWKLRNQTKIDLK